MEILILVGKSGAGKTTLQNKLCEALDAHKVISYTTRPIRKGEVDGEDYIWISQSEFDKLHKEGKFIESVYNYGASYGLTASCFREDKLNILVVTPHGVELIKEYFRWRSEARIDVVKVETKWYKRLYRLIRRDGLISGCKRFLQDKSAIGQIDYDYVIENNRRLKND